MRILNRDLRLACGLGCATVTVLMAGVSPSWALACVAPAPLIGVTGPYGIAAAAIAYGGFLVYKKLKQRS